MQAVFDSSTLILLAKTDVLRQVAEEVKILIPPRVRTECLAKETFDALLISGLIREEKIRMERIGSDKAVLKLVRDFRIERGEAEALWLARSKDCVLAVDDGPTLRACRVLDQPFATAIHFLIDLRVSEQLDAETAMVKLEKLAFYGRYSNRIVEDARRRLRGG